MLHAAVGSRLPVGASPINTELPARSLGQRITVAFVRCDGVNDTTYGVGPIK